MWRHHLATFGRVMVTPARLFEILTAWTFGAQRRNHMESTAFGTIAKKKTKKTLCPHAISIYHELSRTQPELEEKCVSVGVDALAVVWRKGIVSITVFIHTKTFPVRKILRHICIHFRQDGALLSWSRHLECLFLPSLLCFFLLYFLFI